MQTTAIFSIGCLGPYLKFSIGFLVDSGPKIGKLRYFRHRGVISAIVVASALEFVALPT